MPYVRFIGDDIADIFSVPQDEIETQWINDNDPRLMARDLAAAVAAKQREVDQYLDVLGGEGVEWPAASGKFVQYRERDQGKVTAQAVKAGLAKQGLVSWAPTAWISADNSPIPLITPEDMIALGNRISTIVEAAIKHARVHKNAIAALTTVEAVNTYDYTTGWPA